MLRQYTVAEARNHLSRVIRDAETQGPVHITRRGRSAVVVLSAREYAQLASPPNGFWAAYQAFRGREGCDDTWGEGLDAALLRDRSPGRPVDL